MMRARFSGVAVLKGATSFLCRFVGAAVRKEKKDGSNTILVSKVPLPTATTSKTD
jgi:hypothetical protein